MKRVGLAAAVAALLLVASSAQAATPAIDIHSAGPLSDIYIGNDLSCQVRSGGFSSTEFFPNASGPGDCGTFFNTGSDSPNRSSWVLTSRTTPGALTHHASPTRCPFTPVSQSLTGSGTSTESVPSYDRRSRETRPSGRSSDRPHVHRGRHLRRRPKLLPDRRHGREHRAPWARTPAARSTTPPTASCEAATRVSARPSHRSAPPWSGCACTLAPSNDQVRERFVPITSRCRLHRDNGSDAVADALGRRHTSQPYATVARTMSTTRRAIEWRRRRPGRRGVADFLVPD